ncbi:extracellular solute-binding protein [Nocardia sp. alder85J]|uniref:extracellular solute-binding protein n=1 Tax=Nocardia sp. alder85J TaxID=2862949 RepID=UPI001CD7A13A|nr:extracellular solute-binding protein [Nocardia sp. alder85J]MCX4097343.1 extracellular solute-binding protein [Nocardia sp. alder85J]
MTPVRWRATTAVAAVLTVLAAATACARPGAGDDRILVYDGGPESLVQDWAHAFTAATGIKVTLRTGDDTDLGNQIVAEGAASPADVFLAADAPAVAQVEHAGLFAALDRDTLAQVPPRYRATTGTWTGIAARTLAFVYDPAKLPADRLPASLLELAQPQWRGRWGADTGGAEFRAVVAAVLAQQGEAAARTWLQGARADAVTTQSPGAAMAGVDAARYDGALVFADHWFRDRAGGDDRVADRSAAAEHSDHTAPHFFASPDPGAVVSVSAGGVLKSSRNQAAAQQFLRFVTGAAGQQLLHDGTAMEYPVAENVPAAGALPPLDPQAPQLDPGVIDAAQVARLVAVPAPK